VLLNLAGNAVKYGGHPAAGDAPARGPEVEVGVLAPEARTETQAEAETAAPFEGDEGPQEGYLTFFVRDHGPGIPQEFWARIWGLFQTLKARDVQESTGIGLAVVRKIVESKGGRAWVRSVVGEGATFYFTWPAV
jgi:signal transduction histidine kinase